MNTFRTEWSGVRFPGTEFTHADRILTSGSCFAHRFGTWLAENKFQVLNNPFGISYQPLAIHDQLCAALTGAGVLPSHFVEREHRYVHLDFHSSLQGGTKEELQTLIGWQQHQVQECLNSAHWLILTYGTAWVYDYLPTGKTINNCHKIPARQFTRRLLNVPDITESFNLLYGELKEKNPALRLLLTISPVRHIKDTLEGNSVSKAVLRVAAHEIRKQHPDVVYFPAFEILMDDLRDYRFYEDDLLHPNSLAEQYIWEKFSNSFFPEATRTRLAQWQSIKKSLAHIPFQPEGPSYRHFLESLLERLQHLAPVLSVENELNEVRARWEAIKI